MTNPNDITDAEADCLMRHFIEDDTETGAKVAAVTIAAIPRIPGALRAMLPLCEHTRAITPGPGEGALALLMAAAMVVCTEMPDELGTMPEDDFVLLCRMAHKIIRGGSDMVQAGELADAMKGAVGT